MSSPPSRTGGVRELGRFLELRALGLNVPFALAFVFVAADGLPPLVPFLLIVVAFVGARNAGHAFNRWADRAYDAANPRTAYRALPAGRLSPGFALAVTAASAAVVVVAAALLSRLALELAPVALAIVLGYSFTKRVTDLSTPFLGLVEALTPAAAFVGLTGRLPWAALLAVAGFFAWGTAFETVHSLGDLDSDRALGLRSLPVRLGREASVRLVVALQASALALLGLFGYAERLAVPYFGALVVITAAVVASDRRLAADPEHVRLSFGLHLAFGLVFLAGVLLAVFLPGR